MDRDPERLGVGVDGGGDRAPVGDGAPEPDSLFTPDVRDFAPTRHTQNVVRSNENTDVRMGCDATLTLRVIRWPHSALPFLHDRFRELSNLLVCVAPLLTDSDADFGFLEVA